MPPSKQPERASTLQEMAGVQGQRVGSARTEHDLVCLPGPLVLRPHDAVEWSAVVVQVEGRRVGRCLGLLGALVVHPNRVERPAEVHHRALPAAAALGALCLAIDETVILLQPPLFLAGVSIVMERERQQNDKTLVNGYRRRPERNGGLVGDDGRGGGPGLGGD